MSRVLVDSGIDWIGKIPANWNIQPLGLYLKERKEKVSDIDYEPLSVTKNGIVPQLENAAKSDAHDQRKKVCKFDFVINSRSDRKQSCGLSYLEGSVSLINTVLKIYNYYPEYIKYALDNNMFSEEFYRNGHGIVADLWTTKYSEMKHIRIPEPNYDEQKNIANFLDKQCAKIDEIINDNNREVELLQEYKSNFISKVIEKGMTGGVKKIDNKYISSIPNNSSLVMLKQITNLITDGTHQTPTYISDGIPFLSIKDISSGIIDLSNCKYISNEEHKALSKHANIEKNDLLFCRIGTLGKSIVVEEKFLPFDIFVSLGLIKIKKEIINPYYLKYVMESNYYKEYIEVVKIDGGVSAAKFNLSSVKSSPIILPKLDEQNLIVKYLNKQCSKLDQVIKYRKQIIEKLEEYKRSLIYECVTGKREV